MKKLHHKFPLKTLNTFGIDAIAKQYFCFSEEHELIEFLSSLTKNPQPLFILGGGSNVLFTKDFEETIIHPQNKGVSIVEENEENVLVQVGAGEEWDDFVAWAVGHFYYGVENLSLIPGNVGAAPIQNIGAYGVEVCQVIEKVKTIDIERGNEKWFQNQDCNFGYRSSIFKTELRGKFIITEVFFRLQKQGELNTSYGNIKAELAKYPEINLKTLRQAVIGIRRSKLPDPEIIGNAGSFFKNPVVAANKARKLLEKYPTMPNYSADDEMIKLAAGWLIEQCGWKGKRIGNAGVHERQALVLVNHGNATGTEIADLSEKIKDSVNAKFGVELETEVNVL
jgi:UDP-N-acetylmuramate dehydrogenase